MQVRNSELCVCIQRYTESQNTNTVGLVPYVSRLLDMILCLNLLIINLQYFGEKKKIKRADVKRGLAGRTNRAASTSMCRPRRPLFTYISFFFDVSLFRSSPRLGRLTLKNFHTDPP
ncbi:hypothetical protein BABINDRAFT_149827 [Babjeviella inositovora NRRL Y-12698]|uniref:Uncharacterized protein n=1 Tax=Babjeviella inositovora NRRL Y-12698 TaxID=984486 RepID=A0A1E3QNG5_9ASCO|nr:uncharacterized protein BABINDRAFT_149827 [Babjeviella inositovora NRRL Y-12698]ODQ79225.1 hypothetical protein BABINDRAFT_149827 [Babjeviella inositovora NRRL Y-12698]